MHDQPEFQQELRRMVDDCFDRPGVDYPLVDVLRGTLARAA